MTVLCLCLAFLLPVGSIALDMRRVIVADNDARELDRLSFCDLPEARLSLLPLDWPTTPQRAEWASTPTGQFWAIVRRIGDLDEPCAHCATPEDGEPAHAGCPGCCCPCGVEATV